MQLDRSQASSPDSTGQPSHLSALHVGARVIVTRLAGAPGGPQRQRLDELVERTLPCIEAEGVPLEAGLFLLENVVLALLAEDPALTGPPPRRHLSLVPQR